MFYDYLTLIGHAALMTLGLASCSLIVGLLLSIIFTALEANKYVFIAKPASVVIALLRGLPEILVVLLIYFGSTQVVEMLTGEYIEFSAFGCGVFALSLIFASYASQTLRGAIQAIPKGQWESGAALGLSRPYTFIHLIMPQVWRHALPGLSNQWLVLLKDTALVSLIGVPVNKTRNKLTALFTNLLPIESKKVKPNARKKAINNATTVSNRLVGIP